ncbi:D-alanyl-D-alanine carboxypeptidase family protein [Altererythrobacter fulvus]|uniref:D-alanyl-D-alanine carboxypeptidase family protein n=1 Tax=Caenibius fulvus TaxID=2126012 RepID=UPI0030183E17
MPAALHADPAPPSDTEAPIALLVDLTSGQVLHRREADRRFLPASVTKVMSAYLAFEMLADGRLKASQTFTVTPELAGKWSGTGSTLFLKPGDKVSVDTLIRGITTVSANDGAVLLAEGAAGSVENWVALMNRTAAELGMDDSHFGTPNGWPDEGATFVTAHDLALLAKAMITRHPQLYARYFGKSGFSYNGVAQSNHDPMVGIVRGADGIKTGYTREAGYNFLGSAAREGRRLVLVIAGTDSEEERARIARDYVEWGFSAFEPHEIFPEGAAIGTAMVQDGATDSVALRTAGPVIADLPPGARPKIELSLHYRGPLVAPIAAGRNVAELEVRIEGMEPYRVPLQAAAAVDKANPWQRVANAVLGWLS